LIRSFGTAQPSPACRAAIQGQLAEGAQFQAERDRRIAAVWSKLTDAW